MLEDGTDLSPADELIAAVWTVVETDPSGTFADLVSLSMSGPLFEGTERTSQSGIGLGFAVSRDTDQGTTAFSHDFSSRSGECEVTMYPTSTGVAGTFACDGIADADGRIFNARGSFATGT